MARGTFGERLKRERELREVSLEEITSATRIGPRFLEALENEEWEKLPGGVFNRGFVRSVARYLGLDEEAFLAEYDLAHGPVVAAQTDPGVAKLNSSSKLIPFLLFVAGMIVVLALIAGGIYWWRNYRSPGSRQGATRETVVPVAKPATTEAAAPVNATTETGTSSSGITPDGATTALELTVSLSAATHLKIEADGNAVLDGDVQGGESRHFTAKDSFEVSAGNSSAVLLELNGQAMPPIGQPGSAGTIKLGRKDLRPASSGNTQP